MIQTQRNKAIFSSFMAFCIVMASSIYTWQEFSRREQALVKRIVEEEELLLEEGIRNLFESKILALGRMADRWAYRGKVPKAEWHKDANNYVQDQRGLRAIQWVDKTFHVRWIEPLKDNEAALGLNLALEAEGKTALEEAREKRTVTITKPVNLVKGGKGYLAYFPIYTDEEFEGFIVGVFDVQQLFGSAIPEKFNQDYIVQVIVDDGVLFLSDGYEEEYKNEWEYVHSSDLYGTEWEFHVWPRASFIKQHISFVLEFVLVGGFILSVVVAYAVYLAITSNQRSVLLARQSVSLKESEERYELAVKGSSVGLWDWNVRTNALYWSPRFKEIVGISETELITELKEFEDRLHPEDREEIMQALVVGHLENREPYDVEYRLQHNKGHYVWIHARGQAIWEEDGKPLRMAGSVDDISYQKSVEQDKEELISKLTESNSELERFAYIASHDMQEPIRMVTSFSEIIKNEYQSALDETGQEYLGIVSDASKRMRLLVEDLLAYSRMGEEGRKHTLFSGEEVLQGVLDNIKQLAEREQANIQHDALPELYGNPVQFMRLIQNLITNAIKYQPKGNTPSVQVGIKEQEDYYLFSIKDNGLGIKQEFIEQVFAPFRRLHSWENIAGTGLGLAICKKILESHNGKIWVESTPGEGSTFYFTFPQHVSRKEFA